jgi:hypothetical protein
VLLRRINEHLKQQNLIAIGLDLIVVVVGIILAFQVDRWYESRQLRGEEISHLRSLSADFTGTTTNIERTVSRHRNSIASAMQLLGYQADQTTAITTEDFYELVADLSYARIADYQRSTYDYLISSGHISTLRNEQLRAELTGIFSRIDGIIDHMRADHQSYWRNDLEPYVRVNLDHVAMMKAVHPDEEFMKIPATLPADHIHAVIGTGEFEGLVSDKRHLSRDLVRVYGDLLDRIQLAQDKISADLSRE